MDMSISWSNIRCQQTGLNFMSHVIDKTGYWYRLHNEATINHLLYMDDVICIPRVRHCLTDSHHQDIQQWHRIAIWSQQLWLNGGKEGSQNCGNQIGTSYQGQAKKVRAINTYTMLVIRSLTGIIHTYLNIMILGVQLSGASCPGRATHGKQVLVVSHGWAGGLLRYFACYLAVT